MTIQHCLTSVLLWITRPCGTPFRQRMRTRVNKVENNYSVKPWSALWRVDILCSLESFCFTISSILEVIFATSCLNYWAYILINIRIGQIQVFLFLVFDVLCSRLRQRLLNGLFGKGKRIFNSCHLRLQANDCVRWKFQSGLANVVSKVIRPAFYTNVLVSICG